MFWRRLLREVVRGEVVQRGCYKMLLREVVRARSCCYNPLLRGQRIRARRLWDYHEDENLRVVRHFITTANFAIHVTSVTGLHVRISQSGYCYRVTCYILQSGWNGDRDGKHSSNLNVWCPLMEGLKDQDSVSRTFNKGNISNNFGSKSSVSNIILLFYQSQLI